MTDPALVGPDPLWKFLLRGKAHVYYGCSAILLLNLAVSMGAPRWLDVVSAFCAGAIFADCWAHQYLH